MVDVGRPMRRRALLTAVTAGTVGLAGCSFRWGSRHGDASGDGATSTPTSTPDSTATTPATGDPGTTDEPPTPEPPDPSLPPVGDAVTRSSAGPRTLAVRPTRLTYATRLELGLGFADREDDGPPYLGVELANRRDHEVVVRVDALPVIGRHFAPQSEELPEPAVVFAPAESNELARWTPEVERGPGGYWRLPDTDERSVAYPERLRLAPGERRRADCLVVGPQESTGRPTGVYETRARAGSVAVTVWHSERPGPTAPSRFDDREVASPFDGDGTGVTWYHDAGPGTPVYVTPSTERAALPASVRFSAVNHTTDTLGCGHWSLFKLVDGDFYSLEYPLETTECRQLRPGGRSHYELRAFRGVPLRNDDPVRHAKGFLGGGTYAVVAGYGAETGSSGALVDLTGSSVDVRPTDDVTAKRDGSTVTVRRDGRDQMASDPATATVTPIDEAERRLIAEQVMRPWNRAVRNTVPFFGDDVEEVVLETTNRVIDQAVAFGSDTHRFTFRGRAYQFVGESGDRE